MENHLGVYFNLSNGLFITHSKAQAEQEENINIRVPAYDEIIVLKEFSGAQFIQEDRELERAETRNFIFYKYEEDSTDDIIWVETKGVSAIPE